MCLACEREVDGSPEQVEQTLKEFKEIVESDSQKCPHPLLRVKTEPLAEWAEPGWALLVFDVSGVGMPIEIEVIESSLGDEFQLAAVEHIEETLKFRPVKVGTITKVFHNWFERVDFVHQGSVPEPSWPDPMTYFAVNCEN